MASSVEDKNFHSVMAVTESWAKFPWLKYDLESLEVSLKMAKIQEQIKSAFLIDKFEQHVLDHPHKPMVIYEDSVYTYAFMDSQANRVANALRSLGLQCGDTAAVFIQSEPAFYWTMLGLLKLGVAAAFLNVNLRLKVLSFSVIQTQPKVLIVGQGEQLVKAAQDVLSDLQGVQVYAQGLVPGQVPAGIGDFDVLMNTVLPVTPHSSVRAGLTGSSIVSYFYTSGTTGLPKPVYLSQDKMNWVASHLQVVGFSTDDILYTPVPLYHLMGGGIGWFSVIDRGSTVLLRTKFSASHFWSDCRKNNVTVVQYVGEIFRYLLAQPKHELDGVHKVKAVFGNGIRKDIHASIQTRFKIPVICEIFGATEGLSATFSFNKPGVVGRISPFLDLFDPAPKALVKCDLSTAQPIRDEKGLCIRTKPGEVGLYLNKVPDAVLAKGKLRVYRASDEANEKKLVHDVYNHGDTYFNYGDAMYLDKDYFVYFYDRLGDTFRWKGENVSTTEVANILTMLDFIQDANVYGVTIPGHDGRAGMAALSLSEKDAMTEDRLKEIYDVCVRYLPSYARPLVLRILPTDVLTDTYKHRKVELIEQGFDHSKVKDAMYYIDNNVKAYVPLTSDKMASFLQSRL